MIFFSFSWRIIFTPSQTARAFSRASKSARPNARILRYSFQLSTKFRRKGKGNLERERERERERRGKAQTRSGWKVPDYKLSNSVHLRKIPLLRSYLNSSVHFAQFSVEPDNIPNMTRVWINSSPDMWRRDTDSFAGWFFSSKFGKWSHCAWEGSRACVRVCVCVYVCVSLALPSLRHPKQDICPEKIRHQNNSVSFLCTCFCLEIFTECLSALHICCAFSNIKIVIDFVETLYVKHSLMINNKTIDNNKRLSW